MRDVVKREIIRLTAKVERAELIVRRQVFPFDKVNEGGNVDVDTLLETLDLFARVLNAGVSLRVR